MRFQGTIAPPDMESVLTLAEHKTRLQRTAASAVLAHLKLVPIMFLWELRGRVGIREHKAS